MRYIIEIDEDHRDGYVYISAGKLLYPSFSTVVSRRVKHDSYYQYVLVHSTDPNYLPGQMITLCKDFKIIVTKHYKSFEEFMTDHPEYFL